MATSALFEPTLITSALKIPPPLAPATVSLTPTRKPSSAVTRYSLSPHGELLQTLNTMVQLHAELPMQLSKQVEKVVPRLLDLHRTAAQKAMGPNTVHVKCLFAPTAKAQIHRTEKSSHFSQVKSPTPLQTTQQSAAGMVTDSSGQA